MSAAVLGAVLSFANVQGTTLDLTLVVDPPAPVALRWGQEAPRASPAQQIHHFRGMATPTVTPTRYQVLVDGVDAYQEIVEPPARDGQSRVAVYGDDRDGPGPHEALVDAMDAARPTLIVHTGDIVRTSEDEPGWKSHLGTTLRIGRRVPVILALGNHELYSLASPKAARDRVLATYPSPQDPLAESMGLPSGVFHVFVGTSMFVVLDSNSPLGPRSPQRVFLERALAERGSAEHVFVALHQGPLSAGMHGGHPEAEGMMDLLVQHKVSAVLAGHDHTYQRIIDRGVSVIVTGGGGAPLYNRQGALPGLITFSSTYNWVRLELSQASERLEAYSLEGVLLDAAELREAGQAPIPDPRQTLGLLGMAVAMGATIALLFWVFLLRTREAVG
ncbi:MAG: metallophosphoesterase [Myxococcota bacterium]